MSKIQAKITPLMDQIQSMMEANVHLNDDISELETLISRVSIYWAHMSDEDKDYIHGARYAIEEKAEWVI